MKKKASILIYAVIMGLLLLSSSCKRDEPEEKIEVSDVEGNIYRAVTIGTQTWMAENLKTTKYNDGTPIPTGPTNSQWSGLSSGAYTIYPHADIEGLNSDAEVLKAYGVLYNWYAVETGNLCPIGWHLPTDSEWFELLDYVEILFSGKKLKSTSGWIDNANGVDVYGFSALPAGYRDNDGAFSSVGSYSGWWNCTQFDTMSAHFTSMSSGLLVFRGAYNKNHGFSVRCLKD